MDPTRRYDQLQAWVDQALAAYPEKIEEYRSGKKGLIGLFMGEVMKYSRGSADPKKASALLREKLMRKLFLGYQRFHC